MQFLRRRRRRSASRTRPLPTGFVGHAHRRQRRTHADAPRARRGRQYDDSRRRSTVNVANTNYFQNEILATGFDLPTSIEFLPDGRMLVVEIAGTIKVLPPPYTSPIRRPSCSSPTSARPASSKESTTSRSTRLRHQSLLLRLLHVGTPEPRPPVAVHRQRDPHRNGRRERVVLYQDPQDADAEHHGGAIISATTASSTSRPASTSTPPRRRT